MIGGNMTEKKAKESTQSTKSKNRQFQVGDLAVYPAHGVGQIQAIESRVVNGEKHDFYIMKVLENGMVIMIPIRNVESVGLRDINNKKDIPRVYDVMKSRKDGLPDNQTWNRRYREYMDKIKTGSLYDVAEVFRDLFLLKLTKDGAALDSAEQHKGKLNYALAEELRSEAGNNAAVISINGSIASTYLWFSSNPTPRSFCCHNCSLRASVIPVVSSESTGG